MATNKKLIGAVPVDTATIVLADPATLQNFARGYDWAEAFEAASSENFGGQATWGVVAARTGAGDGLFGVWLEYNKDGLPTKLIVDFDRVLTQSERGQLVNAIYKDIEEGQR